MMRTLALIGMEMVHETAVYDILGTRFIDGYHSIHLTRQPHAITAAIFLKAFATIAT